MADKRAFAKFDVGYLDNPKMADVLDGSLYAVCMHFASVLYCSQHLTDGIVAPKAMQRKVGGGQADTQILIDAGLWHKAGHDCEACQIACPDIPANRVYVHDFLEHNRDAAEAKRVSKKRSDAAKVRWAKEETPQNTTDHDHAKCMQHAVQSEAVCNAEREREKERKNKEPLTSDAEASDTPPSFPPHVIDLCEHLASKIKANGNKVGTVGKAWWQSMDRLNRLDAHDPEEIRQVIDWSQASEFWQGNILSAPKLRDKFDTMRSQMKNDRTYRPPNSGPSVPNQYRMFNP